MGDDVSQHTRFVEYLENEDIFANAPNPSWIHTLWYRRSPLIGKDYDRGSKEYLEQFEALARLVPRVVNLKGFVCRMDIKLDTFALLSNCHAEKLTKLLVILRANEVRQAVPLLNRFSALRSLHLGTYGPYDAVDMDMETLEAPHFPKLRVLELKNAYKAWDFTLRWFEKASLPQLREFRIITIKKRSHDFLFAFLAANGSGLTTLGIRSLPLFASYETWANSRTAVFPNRLKYLEITGVGGITQELQDLPNSVVAITLKEMEMDISIFVLSLSGLAGIAERAPEASKLSTIKVESREPHIQKFPLSFIKLFAKEQNAYPKVRGFYDRALRLKARGIRFLDEEGTDATEAIAAAFEGTMA
jgi:hypothetical protein